MNIPIREQATLRTFRPDLPGNTFLRLATALAVAHVRRTDPLLEAERFWPSDRTTLELVARAATAPAMTTVPGWAAELAQRVVADALLALGPASAGAEVLKRSLLLNFNGAGAISVPGFAAVGTAAFVAEGQPIPVKQLAATPRTLNPHKLAAIAVLTREMAESSNAEAIIGDALIQAAGRSLDVMLFDANSGDAARPPGLRNGIAATPASSNASAGEAIFEDIAALINALAPVGGNGPYIIVGSPGRAALMGLRSYNSNTTNLIYLGSSALTTELIAIAPAAVAAAMSPEPAVESSKAGTLVMEDTAPGAAGTAGPERSVFQTDSIALKMRWPLTWELRDLRGVAWMTPVWKAPTP